MKKYINIAIRAVISFILSGSILSGAVAIFSYVEPDFTVSLFDLLSQYSVPAWLLLFLSTAVIHVLLSKLPAAASGKSETDLRHTADREQSD